MAVISALACQHGAPPHCPDSPCENPLSHRRPARFRLSFDQRQRARFRGRADSRLARRVRRPDRRPARLGLFRRHAARARSSRRRWCARSATSAPSPPSSRSARSRSTCCALRRRRSPGSASRARRRLRARRHLRHDRILDQRRGEQRQSRRALRRLSDRQFRAPRRSANCLLRGLDPLAFRAVHGRLGAVRARRSCRSR